MFSGWKYPFHPGLRLFFKKFPTHHTRKKQTSRDMTEGAGAFRPLNANRRPSRPLGPGPLIDPRFISPRVGNAGGRLKTEIRSQGSVSLPCDADQNHEKPSAPAGGFSFKLRNRGFCFSGI
jgi:hypothetical protein